MLKQLYKIRESQDIVKLIKKQVVDLLIIETITHHIILEKNTSILVAGYVSCLHTAAES